MIDEKLSDDEIRELWAEHFPKRRNYRKSRTLCRALCLMVEQRAATDAIEDENLLVQVHRVIHYLGIPREEFYQMEKKIDTKSV